MYIDNTNRQFMFIMLLQTHNSWCSFQFSVHTVVHVCCFLNTTIQTFSFNHRNFRWFVTELSFRRTSMSGARWIGWVTYLKKAMAFKRFIWLGWPAHTFFFKVQIIKCNIYYYNKNTNLYMKRFTRLYTLNYMGLLTML